jgi:hypothetical protein
MNIGCTNPADNIILKWTMERWDGMVWTGLIWDGSCEHGN